jgi:hypothetical protein
MEFADVTIKILSLSWVGTEGELKGMVELWSSESEVWCWGAR